MRSAVRLPRDSKLNEEDLSAIMHVNTSFLHKYCNFLEDDRAISLL